MSGRPDGDRQEFVVAAKGAPEAIAGLCRLGDADRAALTQSVDAMAAAGLRVLGVARATSCRADMAELRRANSRSSSSGLSALPIRCAPSVLEAVRECRSAGIKAVMITGDYPATAKRDRASGRPRRGELVTGEELEKLSDAELARRVEDDHRVRAHHAGAEAADRQRAARPMARSSR